MVNKIRPATLADCAPLAQIDAHDNPSAWSVAQFQAACQSLHDKVCVCENGQGEIVGFAVWQGILDEMELHLIATAPQHRRQGVATALLAHLFQAACNRAAQRILLEVRAGNVGAQALYRQHGFHEIGRRKRYYQNQEDAVLMEKSC